MTRRPLVASALLLLSVVAVCATTSVATATATTPGDARADSIRASVAAALPVVQRSGEEWYESRSCSSCHHAALNLLAVSAARERGLPVDDDLAGRLLARYRRSPAEDEAETLEGQSTINPQIGQSYRLLALAACREPANSTTDVIVFLLLGKQHPDGRWASESHRPPLEDSEFTATALAARALQSHALPGRAAEIAQRVQRAHAWLAAATPATTEESVMRLFGLAWTDGTPGEVAVASAALLREQRPDGGWAQIPARGSDAYATGEALIALHHAGGLAVTDPAYERGVDFLLRTQLQDGTWLVETRRRGEGLKYFETGFPHGTHQFISFTATCWAISALSSALDPAVSPIWSRPTRMPRAASGADVPDDGLTPLVRAAAYDDAAAVTALLEAGADPNLAGLRGVTPLVVAVGDLAKVRVLLEHGADADARSPLGMTALSAAASTDGARDVLALLLEGAPAVDDLGEALCLAAIGGDLAKVNLLLAAGAPVDAKNAEGATAMALAGWQGDVPMVRALLAQGADPEIELMGARALANAVIDGQQGVVEALLETGAQLETRDDSDGHPTPLMWAATVDHGTTATLEALLAKGADVNARDDHGDTALRRAEANGLPHFAALLRAAGATE